MDHKWRASDLGPARDEAESGLGSGPSEVLGLKTDAGGVTRNAQSRSARATRRIGLWAESDYPHDHGGKIFQLSQDHTQGDAYVRGEGAETGKELTDLIVKIQDRQTKGIVENQEKIQLTMLVTSAAMILIIIVFSVLLILALIKPVRRIVRFNQFLEANFHQRGLQYVDADHKQDEIGNMINSHNNLITTIEDYNKNLENMVEERTLQLDREHE